MNTRGKSAFTLIELLLVLSIIVLLVGLAVPAITSSLRGYRLTAGGQLAIDQFTLARQEAITRNQSVQVRFYRTAAGLCGLGSGLVQSDGTVTPLGRVYWLTEDVQLSAALTTMTGGNFTTTGLVTLPARGSVSYFAVVFRPDGSLNGTPPTGSSPYLTLVSIGDSASPPKNFFVLQVNPVTGRLKSFRP